MEVALTKEIIFSSVSLERLTISGRKVSWEEHGSFHKSRPLCLNKSMSQFRQLLLQRSSASRGASVRLLCASFLCVDNSNTVLLRTCQLHFQMITNGQLLKKEAGECFLHGFSINEREKIKRGFFMAYSQAERAQHLNSSIIIAHKLSLFVCQGDAFVFLLESRTVSSFQTPASRLPTSIRATLQLKCA